MKLAPTINDHLETVSRFIESYVDVSDRERQAKDEARSALGVIWLTLSHPRGWGLAKEECKMRIVKSDSAAFTNWYIEQDGVPVAGPFRTEKAAFEAEMKVGNRQNCGPCPERKNGPNGDHVYLEDLRCRFCGKPMKGE